MAKYQSLDEPGNESSRCFNYNCLFLFLLVLSIFAGYIYLICKDIGHVSQLFFKESSQLQHNPELTADHKVGSIHSHVPSSLHSDMSTFLSHRLPGSNCQCNCSLVPVKNLKVNDNFHLNQASSHIPSSGSYAYVRNSDHLVDKPKINRGLAVPSRFLDTQDRQRKSHKKWSHNRMTYTAGPRINSWVSKNIFYRTNNPLKRKSYPVGRLNKPGWVRNLK